MAKCERCGASFFGRRKVKLKDAYICGKCYNELGFDNYLVSDIYTYNEIKDGYEAYWERKNRAYWQNEADKLGLNVEHYKKLNSIGATDLEKKIFGAIYALLCDEEKDADKIEISLGDNGSVCLSVDGVVFITYKADSGVKWIVFENESREKIRIGGAARMNTLAPRIVEAYNFTGA